MSVRNEEVLQILEHLDDKNKEVARSFLSWLLEKQMDEDDDYLTAEDIQAIYRGQSEVQHVR